MKRKPTRIKADAASIERDLRVELRGILRQYDDLKRPFDRFEVHPHRGENEPRFFVAFDRHSRLDITGLRAAIKAIELPDERILEQVARFAESVWHLKDYLHRAIKAKGLQIDLETIIRSSEELRVCADLANRKKHGGCENRSGLRPRLGVPGPDQEHDGEGIVQFDTSRSGICELYYNGARKSKELLVSRPAPIRFTVHVLVGAPSASKGDAVDYIYIGFTRWRPILRELRVLDGVDPETVELRQRILFDIREAI